MSAATWPTALAAVLKHEGGYVNHPADPGGRTNLGVTQRVWEAWTNQPADEAVMRALTPELVAPLYRERYWNAVRGDELPAGVDLAVFDVAVNSGTGRAGKLLQQAIGAAVDGAIGPRTVALATAADPAATIDRICDLRLEFLRALPIWPTFGKGWSRRVEAARSEAKALIDIRTATH
jgi:lysozyme family protein